MEYVLVLVLGLFGGLSLGSALASVGLPLVGFLVLVSCLGFAVWAVIDVGRMR